MSTRQISSLILLFCAVILTLISGVYVANLAFQSNDDAQDARLIEALQRDRLALQQADPPSPPPQPYQRVDPPLAMAPEKTQPDNTVENTPDASQAEIDPAPIPQGLQEAPRRADSEHALSEQPDDAALIAALRDTQSHFVDPAIFPPKRPDFGALTADAPLPPARPTSLAALMPPSERALLNPQISGSNGPDVPVSEPSITDLGPQPSGSSTPDRGFYRGAPAYVRIFKREGELELWLKRGDRFALFKTFPVCKSSGVAGPKTRQGDYQSPEGFYSVSARQLNPHSAYHLAFDVGYPNAFDRRHNYTGSAIMVHGDCKSVGCFAMTNRGIEEIYGYVEAALRGGQRDVPVHIFPFHMSEANIARESIGSGVMSFMSFQQHPDWTDFWRNLKEGYDLFERTHQPPTAFVCGDRYAFGAAARSCSRIAGR